MKKDYKDTLDKLLDVTESHARVDGFNETAIPFLKLNRSTKANEKVPSVFKPSLCVIVQGSKDVILAEDIYTYTPGEFIVTTVDLPVTGQVTLASPKKPYLCVVIELEPEMIFDVLKNLPAKGKPESHKGIFVGEVDQNLMEACLRLVGCLNSQLDGQFLAPMILREIIYRMLTGEYGETIKQLGIVGSQIQRMASVIDRIKLDYTKTLRMEKLAAESGMSPASFHKYFKEVTTMSPLQYQKQIRLQEARKLLLSGKFDAATVSYEVGYESPSQFSREYARLFGLPPKADMKQLKVKV